MAVIKWIKKYEKKVRVIPSPPKPQTNADRIKSMTDEELAEFLCTVRDSDIEPWCNVKNCDTQKTCHDCQIEWLRKKEETKWSP